MLKYLIFYFYFFIFTSRLDLNQQIMKQKTNAKKIWQKPEITDLDVKKAKGGMSLATAELTSYYPS